MDNNEEEYQQPVCPSCGRASPGFLEAENNKKIKKIFFLFILAYGLSSTIFLVISAPARGRWRGYPIPILRPSRIAMPYDDWLTPLFQEPVFQIIIAIGFVLLILFFNLDWWWQVIHEWRQSRSGKLVKTAERVSKHKCRYCGRLWYENSA